MPDRPPSLAVVEAIYNTVHGFPGGAAVLAKRMGMPAGTLTQKANTHNTQHNMRPDELVALQYFTGNPAVLMAMAAALGYTVTPATPDQSGGSLVQALVRAHVQVADVSRAVADPLARLDETPGEFVTGNEVRRVEFHVQEAIAALGHLVAVMRGNMRPVPKDAA